MEFQLETNPFSQIAADILVLGVFLDESVGETIRKLDPDFPLDFAQSIDEICLGEGFTGKTAQTVHLPTYGRISAGKLILRGLGKSGDYCTAIIRKSVAGLARRLTAGCVLNRVSFCLPKISSSRQIQAAVEGWILGSYNFDKYKCLSDNHKKSSAPSALSFVAFQDIRDFGDGVRRAEAIASACNFARDLIAEPAAFMTPTRLAEAAQSLSCGQVTCKILDAADTEKLGMGAFLGVARGAEEPPRFIVLKYSHPEASKSVVIVGKGITFDSGGLSLKTSQGMENMKYDMAGAAVVIAVMKAVCQLKPRLTLTAVAAATENMPSGRAIHPGDVLFAMNGKSIEVNNTDAEGRLVLADALCYAAAQKPDEIIDVATLTGAVVTALGRACAGIMGNSDELIGKVIGSALAAGEKLWQLPLLDEYKDSLKSEIADLKNAGSKGEAPSSCAGMFLKEFVNGCPWAHLDIAGPAWSDKEKDELNKGGTAFGVRTLCYYLTAEG